MTIKDRIAVSKKGIIYAFGSLFQTLLPFLLIPILTEKLSATEYGTYSFIYVTSTFFGAVFYLGMTSSLPRSYFDYLPGEERNTIYTLSMGVILIGSIFQILIGNMFGDFISNSLLSNILYSKAITWSLIANAFNFIILHFISFLRLIKKAFLSVLFSLLIPLISLISLYISFKFFSYDNSVNLIFKSMAISNFIIILILVPFNLEYIGFKKSAIKQEIFPMLKYGIWSVFAALVQYFFDWEDRFLVQSFSGIETFGVYSAVARLASVGSIIFVVPFAFVWNPIMMESRRKKEVKLIFRKAINIYICGSTMLLIPFLFFSKDFISFLIRSELIPVNELIYPFFILICGVMIYGSINIFSAGINFSRKIYLSVMIFLSLIGVKYFLGINFISKFGLYGASITSFLSSLLLVFSFNFVGSKYFLITMDKKFILRVFTFILISIPITLFIISYTNYFYLKLIFSILIDYFGLCLINKTLKPHKLFIKGEI